MLTKEILCAYAPHGVKVQYQGIINTEELSEHKKKEPKGWDVPDGKYTEWLTTFPDEVIGTKYSDIKEVKFYKGYVRIFVGKKHGYLKPMYLDDFKLILRPLSSLTKPITHNGETFVFTELFEIGDEGGFIYDFGNGNTKLISNIESIDKYRCYHDINYLPYPVVKLMYEYHFDVHCLLESGHAIELKEVDNG